MHPLVTEMQETIRITFPLKYRSLKLNRLDAQAVIHLQLELKMSQKQMIVSVKLQSRPGSFKMLIGAFANLSMNALELHYKNLQKKIEFSTSSKSIACDAARHIPPVVGTAAPAAHLTSMSSPVELGT